MDTYNTDPIEEPPEILAASSYPLTSESVLDTEKDAQIEIDLPSGPAIVSRASIIIYKLRIS